MGNQRKDPSHPCPGLGNLALSLNSQDTGGADLFLSGVFFTGIIVLARNNFGHPIMKLQDCYAQVSHAHVSFSGDLR